MKTCKYELLSENDFWSLENIAEEVYLYDLVLVVANTKEIDIKAIEKWLNNKEIEKSKFYISETAKINFVVSRCILNLAFRKMLKMEIDDLNFQRKVNNKPFIENSEEIKFNISHTDGCAIVGFSKREIGVDIEKLNKSFNFKDIVKYCFTSKEIKLISNEVLTFFKYWTAKEAYLKYEGSGLTRNPKEIEIAYMDNKTIIVKDKIKEISKELIPIELFGEYIGAICRSEEQ